MSTANPPESLTEEEPNFRLGAISDATFITHIKEGINIALDHRDGYTSITLSDDPNLLPRFIEPKRFPIFILNTKKGIAHLIVHISKDKSTFDFGPVTPGELEKVENTVEKFNQIVANFFEKGLKGNKK